MSILSIPRDLFVPNARSDGANKIDAALYQGPDQLIAAIEEDFGHSDPALRRAELRQLHQRGAGPRRHQDVLPRAGLRRVLGPEHPDDRLPLPERYPGAPGRAGPARAVQGSRRDHDRPRHTGPRRRRATSPASGATTSSCAVLAAAVKAKGLSNPITDQQLVSGVVGQLTVDSGFSASDMIRPGPRLPRRRRGQRTRSSPCRSRWTSSAATCTRAGATATSSSRPSRRTTTPSTSSSGLKSGNEDTYPAARSRAVDGDGVRAERLRRLQPGDRRRRRACRRSGSTSGRSATARRSAARPRRSCTTRPRRRRQLAAAQAVANSLSGAVIMALGPDAGEAGSQVTVVTGTDFSVNPAPWPRACPPRRPRRRPRAAPPPGRRVRPPRRPPRRIPRTVRSSLRPRLSPPSNPGTPRSCSKQGNGGA